MFSRFVEDLESRSLFSGSVFPAAHFAGENSNMTAALHVSLQVAKPPTAKLSAKPITAAVSSYTLKVTYHSSTGINASTIATGNVTVSGPNGYTAAPALVSISPAGNAKAIVAMYSVSPPSGAMFTYLDNGTYPVTLVTGSVTDINGVSPVMAALGAFKSQIKIAPPPLAKLVAKPIKTAVSAYTIKVTYHSSASVNASSIATGNVIVSGPNGYTSAPALVSITPSANAKAIIAIYSVAPPSGATFTSADNGVYTVTLAAGSVLDTNSISAKAGPIGTFKSQIKGAAVTPPTASLSAQSITSAATSYTFDVTYQSSAGINASSIATGNVTVSGPNGYSNTAALVSISPTGNATSIVATYSITPPSGSAFASTDNGTYKIALAGGSVTDVNNVSAHAATLGSFAVNIQAPTSTLPNMIRTYNGTNIVPSAGSYHYVQLTVATEDAAGNISGSWVTDVGVVFNFTGTVASDGTFSYTFSTGPNTNHATGPVTGSGTGAGAGTSALAFNFTATSQGFTAPGTMNVTKA